MISVISCDMALPISMEALSRVIQKSDANKLFPFAYHIFLIVILPLPLCSPSFSLSLMVLRSVLLILDYHLKSIFLCQDNTLKIICK